MGLRINTNVASLSAQRSLGITNRNLNDNLRKLSSGERVTRSGDDAAGLAISENLKSQIRGLRQAKRNANDAISLLQVAEGGMNEISNIIVRLRELSVQAASDTIGETERGYSDIEFQNLKEEVQRIAESTEFNGIKLLNGTGDQLEFQVGIKNDPMMDRLRYDASSANATIAALGLDTDSVKTKLGAQNALGKLDKALIHISGNRANLGALQNRLQSTNNNLEISEENLSAANSRIRDVDVASETADMTKNNILLQSGMSVLSQANQSTNTALKLLNG